ncbi:MAG: L-histidine N(alpha)-methyltransferase [Woeseiaceae bacterium]
MHDEANPINVLDFEPATATFLGDVVSGLSADEKRLPCKYLYDRRGSKLFEQICQLDEYYLTRSEFEIMRRFAPEMAAQIGPSVMLIEYGSGSSVKTRLLLDHLENPVAYVPVDISRQHLQQSAQELAAIYPHIQMLPVCADFTREFNLPIPDRAATHSAVYFPGSTIGNLQPDSAIMLLGHIAPLCGTGGGLLIGIDLKKDVETVEAAYNDKQGVTAEFNRNLLHRINRELDADFQPDQFRHRAVYNNDDGRIEMHLVSEQDQVVSIGEHSFDFAEGEMICTEYSHKYTIDEFEAIAADVGLTLRRQWTDRERNFAVLHFVIVD